MNQSLTHPRSLSWRLWWRAISVKRSQAALAMASLLVGAAVTSMLLNLYGDARRKMTQEFRAFGANVVLAPASVAPAVPSQGARVMDEAALGPLTEFAARRPGMVAAPILYGVVRLHRIPADSRLPEFENVVAVGTDYAALRRLNPGWRGDDERVEQRQAEKLGKGQGGDRRGRSELAPGTCAVGAHLATRWRVRVGDSVTLQTVIEDGSPPQPGEFCRIATVLLTGVSEDDQVFLPLGALQSLVGMKGKISLIELSIPGETADVERAVHELRSLLPGVEVRPIRQIVYSEGKVLGTIRWLLLSLTGLILVIIALCVVATMTAIVLERRKDIGVMKALGASDPLVMRLFLTEGASLGLVGGAAGFFVGLLLADRMAHRLFATALSPNWWTLPLVVFLTTLLAVVAALFPVRIIRGIQPALVLKGE